MPKGANIKIAQIGQKLAWLVMSLSIEWPFP